jgi:hypothetical protein
MTSSKIDITAEVERIVARFRNPDGTNGHEREDVRNALIALDGIHHSEGSTLRYREFEIVPGYTMYSHTEAAVLGEIRPLNLGIAPELVGQFPLADRQDVIVRRYWACPDEQLASMRTANVALSDDACRRFRSELRVLAEKGFIHPLARSMSNWLISSETKTIVLIGWTRLRETMPGDLEDLLEHVDHQLKKLGWTP